MFKRLNDQVLPEFSRKEEKWHLTTHIVGACLSGVFTIICIALSLYNRSPIGVVSSLIYGAGNIVLFIMSSVYHGLHFGKAKKVFQIIDRCTLGFMFVCTYVPIVFCRIMPVNKTAGWFLIFFELTLAALSILLNTMDVHRYRNVTMFLNILLGLGVLFVLPVSVKAITGAGVFLLVAGGMLYILGSIGMRKKYMHTILHFTGIAACITQFIGICFFVL